LLHPPFDIVAHRALPVHRKRVVHLFLERGDATGAQKPGE